MEIAIDILQRKLDSINSVLRDKEWGRIRDDGDKFMPRSRLANNATQIRKAIKILKSNHQNKKMTLNTEIQ